MILSVPRGPRQAPQVPAHVRGLRRHAHKQIDVLPYFDFDLEKVREYALMRNPKIEIIPISAKTGEGMDKWCDWLRREVNAWKKG